MTARVLHLSFSNAAGLPQAWCRAHKEAGVEALHVSEIFNDFGYWADECVRWSYNDVRDRIAPYLDACTHVVIHDVPSYCETVIASGKPWMYRAFGTATYLDLTKTLRLTEGIPRVCDFAEYMHHGFDFLPMPVWMAEYPTHNPQEEFTVAHAPSVRAVKGTEGVIRACRRAGVRLELIENASHADCLRRKARCHAYVDMIIDENHPRPERSMGFAVNGLEAWAIGMPVLGEQHPSQADSQAEIFGRELPYINVTEETLPEALIALRDSESLRNSWVGRGQRYLRAQRNPQQQGLKDLIKLGVL